MNGRPDGDSLLLSICISEVSEFLKCPGEAGEPRERTKCFLPWAVVNWRAQLSCLRKDLVFRIVAIQMDKSASCAKIQGDLLVILLVYDVL